VQVVSSSNTTAQAVARTLAQLGLCNPAGTAQQPDRFYVSDHTPGFQRMADLFFGANLHLARIRLGD
jgi:glutamate racemase